VTDIEVISAVNKESDGVWCDKFAALSQQLMKPAH